MALDPHLQSALGPPIPNLLPLLPLKGAVAFPLTIIPISIGQPSSIELIDRAMSDNRLVLLVTQRQDHVEKIASLEELYPIGTVAVIHRLTRAGNGTVRLMMQGIERARPTSLVSTDPYFIARLQLAPEHLVSGVDLEGLRVAALSLLKRLVGLLEEFSEDLIIMAEGITDIRQLAYLIALVVPFSISTRQEILETDSLEAKLKKLVEFLQHEVEVRELGHKIIHETQERLSKAQREYFLREQVRSIQNELGEGKDQLEIEDIRKKIDEAGLPEEARKEALHELDRLATTPVASPEYGMIRSFLDWMINLPWNKLTGSEIDIPHAKQILDEDHYDLDKVKDRILEYLAVKKLRQERGSMLDAAHPSTEKSQPGSFREAALSEPILCFVGPPGVGKTSLGQSIARALGRKFARISLGGMHDEAEIRGHRRTYIGSMPGRIIQGIRRAEARDPVFMLDEIDKVGADWRGDPSSALLEVLDPAQNHTFMDNYLGVTFDLSQVLFITTANTLDTIPLALLDRMEVLRLSGYTDDEKVHIAQQYLIPKEIMAHGLKPEELSFDNQAIRYIIRSHTHEAGIRNLDREIAAICRKIAREVAEGKQTPVYINQEQVELYLGRPQFFDEVAERTEYPGVATGLAWTPVGGDVLFVEASMMPSRDERLILTGMLGDVMRESAQAALSYIRANAQFLKVDPQVLEGKIIHLHVPAGAIPKDGPSAGVTLVTALASLISGRPVRNDIAMTGEITLRGKVLPVGGIKEKILAAHRAGIKTVILPRHNERDLEDIPDELRQEMQYHLVDTIQEVINYSLRPSKSEP